MYIYVRKQVNQGEREREIREGRGCWARSGRVLSAKVCVPTFLKERFEASKSYLVRAYPCLIRRD